MNRKITQASVMIVDDVAENLQVLSKMLQQEGFLVRPVPAGQLAINAAVSEPPDIILLDIMMPDIDGYQVCRTLKLNPATRDIPILFISALTETFDKVKAFQAGGVDYITKPFQLEEVQARVRTHLELHRLNLENQALLAKTLSASARSLVDMLAVVNPVIFEQSNRLRRYMKAVAKGLDIVSSTGLQWEMAAMLSQLGCMALPELLLQKKQQGDFLTVEEIAEFQKHAFLAADLIGGIPRMEMASEIIRRQHEPFRQSDGLNFSLQDTDAATLGGHILRMLVDFDYLQMSGRGMVGALLTMQENPEIYSPGLLESLRYVVEEEGKEKTEWVMLSDLTSGMILLEDIVDETGNIVLHRTSELTTNLINLLGYCAMKQKIRQPIAILANVPSIIKRNKGMDKPMDNIKKTGLVLGDLVVDMSACTVKLQNTLIHLTATEYKILEVLCQQPGKVLSRMQMAEGALGIMFEGYDRTIDAHIKNIRQKMGAVLPDCNYIQTVRGIGYKIAK
jgi:putative two-component system response regulator